MEKFKQFLNIIIPISDQEFADTISFFSVKNLKKGDFFVKENKVCTNVAYIVSGSMRTYYVNEKGVEITSCFCTENNFVTSYKSFILQQPSNLILQANEATQLLVIDFETLHKLYERNAKWQTIGRTIAEREYIAMEQYASVLNNETAKEKYMRLLKDQPEVLQKATIEEIASYLGVTRRTLTRIRKELAN